MLSPDLSLFVPDAPFSLFKERKDEIYPKYLSELTIHHFSFCKPYHDILKALGYSPIVSKKLVEIPFIPVRLFKFDDFYSVKKEKIVKTLNSSGTSGQGLSKIYLDRNTAVHQSKVLVKIISNFLGEKRLPMLIIDSESTLKNRHTYSARAAGILGFSILGRDITYALDENMNVDINAVNCFYQKYRYDPVFLFGFTYVIWQHFHIPLVEKKISVQLPNGTLIHGGGWKKVSDLGIDNHNFKKYLGNYHKIKSIYNYYGMIEQTGSIFMECEAGFFHCSNFSDILIRDENFKILPNRHSGLLQSFSCIPFSYPGHSILTEDIGSIIGEDDCKCGRKGKYFEVKGRLEQAEIRGCSDTLE